MIPHRAIVIIQTATYSSYNEKKLSLSRYSNTETSLAMSTLATWSHVVQSRDVSPHNFDGLAMSGLAFSVAPFFATII